jgi:uncharacterized glyoxalase superfamily protein PhnB
VAIDWLCRAFGVARHLVMPGEDGTIAHAQLTFGNGTIMLGSARDDANGAAARSREISNGSSASRRSLMCRSRTAAAP